MGHPRTQREGSQIPGLKIETWGTLGFCFGEKSKIFEVDRGNKQQISPLRMRITRHASVEMTGLTESVRNSG
jgi:hypothetical protein